MIKVIVGMIGSGKTTYALTYKHDDDILLDYDFLVDALKSNKLIVKVQNILLDYYSSKGINVWYITTIVGSTLLSILKKYLNVEIIWINTTKTKCIENIKKRNRHNEVSNLDDISSANDRIYNYYYLNNNQINYKIVDVFNNNERW